MIYSTLKEYKENFHVNLDAYLNEYFENTKSFFLENELLKYQDYHDSLTSIPKQLNHPTVDEIKNLLIYSGIASQLKKIDKTIYYDIVTELKKDGDEVDFDNLSEEELMKDLITIDLIKLQNHVNSSNRILEFISKQQQPEVPGEETVVGFEANAKPKKLETASQSGLNDYTKSTIEECLFDIKDDINPAHYEVLVDALYNYFTTGMFPTLKHQIIFKSVNKKKVGWALKEAYKNVTSKILDIEYFRFAKNNINLFKDEVIYIDNFRQSKFYKLFTTKP